MLLKSKSIIKSGLVVTGLMLSVSISAITTSNHAYCATTPNNTVQKEKVTLYGISLSPYVRKARVVLHEKNIQYELVETLPLSLLKATQSPISDDFVNASPLGKIPALVVDGWALADSGAISAYVDRKNAQNSLYPKSPKLLGKTIWFEKYGDEVVFAVTTKAILIERILKPKVLKLETDEKTVQKALNEDLPQICDYLEQELGNKKWIVGNQFTVADIAIVSQFISLEIVGEKVDADRWPKLASYINRVKDRESFKKVL